MALGLTGCLGLVVLGYRWLDRAPLRQAAAAERDDWYAALRQVEAFRQTHAHDRQALLLLARCRARLGPFDEAERFFAQVPDLAPADERLRAENLARLKLWSPAAEIYERLLARSPDDPYLLRQLAIIEFQVGKYPTAIELCQRLAQFPRSAAVADYLLGAIENNLGNAARAVEALQRMLGVDPTAEGLPASPGQVYALLGENLLALGRTAEARAALDRAAATAPDADSFYFLGKAWLRLRQPEAATEWWFRALERNPHHGPTLEALAQQALTEGRPEEAIGWLKLADRYSLPSTAEQYLLSRAYTLAGRPDLGRHYLDETRRRQAIDEREAVDQQITLRGPTSPRAKLIRARRAAAAGNWKQAEIWVDELVQQFGDQPELRHLRHDIAARRAPAESLARPAASR